MGNTPIYLTRSARSEVFCVSSERDPQERSSSEELGFSLHSKEETGFFLYREKGRESVKIAMPKPNPFRLVYLPVHSEDSNPQGSAQSFSNMSRLRQAQ